jgi:hypothetical protein
LSDRRREKTTFAVVFTSSHEAVVVGKKENDWKDGRENVIGKREWKGIGKKDGNRE